MEDEEGDFFAGVIGARPGGVIAVVSGEDDEVSGADFAEEGAESIDELARPLPTSSAFFDRRTALGQFESFLICLLRQLSIARFSQAGV